MSLRQLVRSGIRGIRSLPHLILERYGHFPAGIEEIPVRGHDRPRPLLIGQELTILSWNLQYAAGRAHHFFYDGGPDVMVRNDELRRTLSDIASRLGAWSPDILLLQELDRCSRRTSFVDELAPLLEATQPARFVTTPYHLARFVPYPPRQMLGQVDLQLALLSRFDLRACRRLQLPQIKEPACRRAFNLHRAILEAEIPIEGAGSSLAVALTHLDAFSYGDGTLREQAEVLDAWMSEREARGQPFILAGDLNLLPPDDQPERLGQDARLYSDRPNPISLLVPKHRTLTPPSELNLEKNRTYLPFGARLPDRKIDWIFVGPGVEVLQVEVLRSEEELSDHLPIRARLKIIDPGTHPPVDRTGPPQ